MSDRVPAWVASRSPFAEFGRRLADWMRCMIAGGSFGDVLVQTEYCFWPGRFFKRNAAPTDVFYLFRDTPERREMLKRVMRGGASGLGGGQLFGFEELRKSNLVMDCNLRFPRSRSVRETLHGWHDRRYAQRTGVGLGDVCSARAHLALMNRARVVLATSDNTGLPAARMKARGRLKVPLVYVSIGLPERMSAVEKISPARAERYRKRLACVNRFVAYGWAEAEWLKQWLGDENKVRFVPFGVDANKWRPMAEAQETIDVLSLGYDSQRDFSLLVNYAQRRSDVSICLATSQECAESLGAVPANLRIRIQVPIEKLRELISSAKVLALPVKENTYSGATTTLLQGMALGKACAVSRVGAIREGYDLADGVNVRWLQPGSQTSFDTVVDGLLAQPELRQRLGIAARRHAEERLSWRRYMEGLADCLSDEIEVGKVK